MLKKGKVLPCETVFLGACVQDEQQASVRHGRAQAFPQKVVGPEDLKVQDVKMKVSCKTSLKIDRGRCENEAFVICGGCNSAGDSGG